MAAMSTVLVDFSDNGNSRTYRQAAHSVLEPKLVIQKRKIASKPTDVAEDSFIVINSTEDADGVALASKVSIEVKIRRPANGIADDVTAALATCRDIVAGDEFGYMIDSQQWLV